jgi:FkbM family methyltransferase
MVKLLREYDSGGVVSSEEILAQLSRMEAKLTRLSRDVEQVKLYTGVTLEPDRAVTLLANGDRIYVDPRDRGCGMNLLTEGRYEENEIGVFRKFLRPGAVVLDIGANYGYYSLVAAPYVRPGGQVLAFEPNPHIFKLMASSVYLNGYTHIVKPHRCGVFDKNATLHFALDASGPGGARIVEPEYHCSNDEVVLNVPVVKLDDFLPPDLIVDVVKIDVEGREKHVLNGMRDIISRSPSIVILMELFASFFRTDALFEEFLSFIRSELGLLLYKVMDGSQLSEVSNADLLGKESYVVLSRSALVPRPDLTIYSQQLNLGGAASWNGRAVVWQGDGRPNALVAHGPYVFLPRGSYQIKFVGRFEGVFNTTFQENFGDVLWRGRIGDGMPNDFNFSLGNDAPKFEVALWSADTSGRYCEWDRVEFWRIS